MENTNTDLENLGDEIFKPTNEFQGIDIERLHQYWLGLEPTTELGIEIKTQHLELIDLVKETGFLNTVAEARKSLKESDERVQADPELDPETILPSRY